MGGCISAICKEDANGNSIFKTIVRDGAAAAKSIQEMNRKKIADYVIDSDGNNKLSGEELKSGLAQFAQDQYKELLTSDLLDLLAEDKTHEQGPEFVKEQIKKTIKTELMFSFNQNAIIAEKLANDAATQGLLAYNKASGHSSLNTALISDLVTKGSALVLSAAHGAKELRNWIKSTLLSFDAISKHIKDLDGDGQIDKKELMAGITECLTDILIKEAKSQTAEDFEFLKENMLPSIVIFLTEVSNSTIDTETRNTIANEALQNAITQYRNLTLPPKPITFSAPTIDLRDIRLGLTEEPEDKNTSDKPKLNITLG